MRKTIAALAVLAIAVAGCGSSGSQTDTAAAERAAARRAAAIKAARLRARQVADHAACERTFSGLQETLGELNSRLSIGLTYADYGTEVADVQVAYDRLDTSDLDFSTDCLGSVGLPLEKALNQHLKAQAAWQACFDDWDCDPDSIDGQLQSRWAKASRATEKSVANLRGMEPEPVAAVDSGTAGGGDENGQRILDVLTDEEAQLIGGIMEINNRAMRRVDPGFKPQAMDSITCGEWSDIPSDMRDVLGEAVLANARDPEPSAASTGAEVVARVTDACTDPADLADGWIAREILLSMGQGDRLDEADAAG